MSKRAQAAMEFLTTYGWAFLVILVMIGALAYFGVLNPQTSVADRCMAPPGFLCENYQLNTESQKIRLRNTLGATINIISDTSLRITKPEAYANCTIVSYNNIQTDDLIDVTCTGNSQNVNPRDGEKIKLDLEFRYYKTDSGIGFNKPAKVQLVSTVQI